MSPIRCLLIKELIQIWRDRRLLSVLILAPMIQLLILGFAANTDVKDLRLAVRDQDHSVQSREYIRTLSSSGTFKVSQISSPSDQDDDLLVAAKAGLVLTIPPEFSASLLANKPVHVQVLINGSDSHFAVHGLNYLLKVTRLFSSRCQRERPSGMASSLPWVRVDSRAWYNPRLVSRIYMVPGMMGLLLMVTTMVVTSMALVKEREEGTMEQLLVTPLRPAELILGKLLPFVVVGYIEISLVVPVMVTVFDVPLRGSVALLYALTSLFFLTTLGLGLFISTVVRTQQQAMTLSALFVIMPFSLLSGFIFPVENMPPSIQTLTHLIPLKYYLRIVRGIFLKGVGMSELWPEVLILVCWGLGILILAVAKFRKRLD